MPAHRPEGAIDTADGSQPVGVLAREGSHLMDEVVNRFARELADSIAAAVAESAQVEACRERARAAGYEMKVNLEAVVGFVNRTPPVEEGETAATKALVPRKPFDITVNDRRFLRSLRIAAEETKVEETN